MTPEQEKALFERVARLEDFAHRLTGVLAATGQALELGRIVAQQVIPPLAGPVSTVVRRLYDFAEEPSEGAKHIDD
jgi:hypothetical protein